MLPDFELALPSFGPGQVLIARDVPTAVFCYGYPDGGVGQAHVAWVAGVLSRVIVQPRLSLEMISRFGGDARVIADQYLLVVGWLTRSHPDVFPVPTELVCPARLDAAWMRALITPPPRRFREGIRQVADHTKTPPHVVWREWAISDFRMTLRIVTGGRRGGGAAPADADAEVMRQMERIGVERDDDDEAVYTNDRRLLEGVS